MTSPTLTKQQIGKAGELLVQLRLLLAGVESAPLTTDAGIDLVAFSSRNQKPFTIQVKTNLRPKPAGGRGKLALDWWVPSDSPADIVALVDLADERVWMLRMPEVAQLAQQRSGGRYHLYSYCDPSATPRKEGPALAADFEAYRCTQRIPAFFHRPPAVTHLGRRTVAYIALTFRGGPP